MNESKMTAGLATPCEEAEMFLSKPRFHQSMTITGVGNEGKLVVSYAEYGCYNDGIEDGIAVPVDNAKIPTVLFMPGMFASRYLGVFTHPIAEKYGVKVLVIDRFGFGQTANVAIEDRVDLWVSIVPKFLAALGIKHVALVSHSSGTIYNLNLLWYCRDILHPVYPKVFFMAPWVDTAHSKTAMGLALQALPLAALNKWNKIAKFVAIHLAGTIDVSSGFLDKLANSTNPNAVFGLQELENMKTISKKFGLSYEKQVEIEYQAIQAMFNENTEGANSEAITCLKKGPKGSWGEAEDMKSLIHNISEYENALFLDDQNKLMVHLFFAENDCLIGRRGREFFEDCFAEYSDDEDQRLDYTLDILPKGNHDSIIRNADVLTNIFKTVATTHGGIADISESDDSD